MLAQNKYANHISHIYQMWHIFQEHIWIFVTKQMIEQMIAHVIILDYENLHIPEGAKLIFFSFWLLIELYLSQYLLLLQIK